MIANAQILFLPYPDNELPGVHVPNGSLWTLPVETCCYVVLLCGWAVLTRSGRDTAPRGLIVAVAVAAAGIALYRYFLTAGFHLLWMFGSGAVYYAMRDRIRLSKVAALLLLAGLSLAGWHGRWFEPAVLLAGPHVVFCAAYLPSGAIRRFNLLGDYSYGTYIYGFPVQWMISVVVPGLNVWSLTALAVPPTVLTAAASWYAVEKPALRSIPLFSARLRSLGNPRWARR